MCDDTHWPALLSKGKDPLVFIIVIYVYVCARIDLWAPLFFGLTDYDTEWMLALLGTLHQWKFFIIEIFTAHFSTRTSSESTLHPLPPLTLTITN